MPDCVIRGPPCEVPGPPSHAYAHAYLRGPPYEVPWWCPPWWCQEVPGANRCCLCATMIALLRALPNDVPDISPHSLSHVLLLISCPASPAVRRPRQMRNMCVFMPHARCRAHLSSISRCGRHHLALPWTICHDKPLSHPCAQHVTRHAARAPAAQPGEQRVTGQILLQARRAPHRPRSRPAPRPRK